MNDNRPKGNQKHMDLSARNKIEQGLNNGDSFRAIAREIDKDPSTISKEVRKHSYVADRKSKNFAPIPCANNHDPNNPRASICKMHHMCGDNDCQTLCVKCVKYRCADICKLYEPRKCPKLSKPPYVCNGCYKIVNCNLEHLMYSSKYAQDSYEDLLVSCREGINQDPGHIQEMNEILTPLIKKGQSIAHIYVTHADDLSCSKRTIYTYIDKGLFDIKNMDLRRKVKYKKRKSSTETPIKERAFRKGRTYKDFLAFIEKEHPVNIVEMDTVEGRKGTKPCFLTMLFRSCNLMLMFLLKEQNQAEVLRVFDYLTEALGIELFQKLFEVILTDNGSEFQYPEILEADQYGEIRTRIYYCDPNRSDQKGALEKNHEYIRYVLPKKSSFEKMDDAKTLLLLNHINSEKRDMLNGHSPYEISLLLLDNRLHQALGLKEIPADDVTLIPALVK